MVIREKEIRHVARLARLAVSEMEAYELSAQLSTVLAHMKTLQGVDTRDVDPMFGPIPSENVFRKDKVKGSLSKEAALQNAPEKTDNFFLVPRIVRVRRFEQG